MSARRRLTTCQLKWSSMFVLLFALLAMRGRVNNNAGLRYQRLPNFNCFDKLPAVILGGFGTITAELKHIDFGNSRNAFSS